MKAIRSVFFGAALAGFAAAPATAQLPCGAFTGGNSFALSLSGCLTYDAAAQLLTLNVTNTGPAVFAAIGIVNVSPAQLVAPGPIPASGWTWETTSQLSGAGLPTTIWSWIAKNPKPQNGLGGGESGTFTFELGSPVGDISDIGFAVHGISGPNDCSSKFGVWNGGASTNDAVANGGSYDSNCVSVPEPESMALLITGLVGLAFVAARRREDELES